MFRSNPPIPGQFSQQLLYVLRSANMAVTTDQTFTKVGSFTNYMPSGIVVVWKSGAFGTACAGGIYTAATKGGTAIVAAAQSYAALTAAGTAVTATIAATSAYFTATPILSLTTGNTGSLMADIFVFGYVVD